MKASKAEASFVYFPLSKPHNWGKDSLLIRRRFIQRLRAIPHNLTRRLSQDFCPNSKFRKWRNTVCISHFWNCGSGAKRRLRLEDAIARCCLIIVKPQYHEPSVCPTGIRRFLQLLPDHHNIVILVIYRKPVFQKQLIRRIPRRNIVMQGSNSVFLRRLAQ